MKRCPECRRDYYDETLLFCLEDGTALLQGSVPSPDEPQTAILYETAAPAEAATRAQIHTTEQTAVLPSGIAEFPKHGVDKRLLFVPLAILILGVVFGIYRYGPFAGSKQANISLATATINKLTTNGKATQVAISPDGKYVVHVQNDGGQEGLYLRQVATHSNKEILPPAPVRFVFIRFSPEGDYIYYSMGSPSDFPRGALFKLPTLGGQPQKIKEDINQGQFSLSPDGRRFVFTRNIEDTTFQMFIANADGTNEEKVLETTSPNWLDSLEWSPDGQRIVYEDFNPSTGSRLNELRLADLSSRSISDKVWCCGMGKLTWTRDGDSLLLWGSDRQGSGQIWQLVYASGEARQLTNDPEGVGNGLGLTADSNTLAHVKTVSNARIWVGSAEKPMDAQPITSGSSKLDSSPAWFPDGRLLFSSVTGGRESIWSMNADGSNSRQITSDADTSNFPVISPVGSTVAYASGRGYDRLLWLMKADGSEPRQITNIEGYIWDIPTDFSQDGKWLFFTRVGFDNSTWKIAADGTGEAVKLSNRVSGGTQVSPNGELIAYAYKDDTKAPYQLAIAKIDGGEPIKTFSICTNCLNTIRWSPDSRSLIYAETSLNGVGNLMSQPIVGGTPKQLTDFKSDLIFSFAYSRDGKQIALSRGTSASDVLLYSNIRR